MTDNTNAGVLWDAVRAFSSFLDRGVYGLLNIVYQVFFNITSVDLFQNEVMMRFYGRIQLILGVFMMFQLAMTVLKGIVDPNSFTDSKSGAGNLVYRVATSLILLTVLVPISTPGRNEFEKRVNNNGILFGTLYSLQYRILNNNTIGKLVLGTTGDNSSMVSTGNQKNDVEYSSRVFTATILRSFYRINLIEESKRTHVDGKEDEMLNANRMCQDIDDATLASYTKVDAEAGDIVSYVNETCSASGGILGAIGQKRYQFYYMAFICPIIGIIFVVVFLSFCVDIAIRSVKLAVLRLIAPIPIISYMDPKGGKDNAFSSWVKTLTSTYLDLFIRLAAVYFVLFVIQDMIYSGIRINTSGGMVGAISIIMIWLGLFIFAKQAPKFIKQAIGLKEDAGGKLFSGFGEAAGIIGLGAGIGAGVLGGIGSGLANARASKMADETRKALGMRDIFGNEIKPDSSFNKAKHLLAGIAGGVGGITAGTSAAISAKDHKFKGALEAMQKRNADTIAKGSDGSTFLGRFASGAQQYWTGDGASASLERDISSNKARIDALKAIKSRVSSEMVKSNNTQGFLRKENGTGGWNYLMKDTSGADIKGSINYKDFMARKKAAESHGDDEFDVMTSSGTRRISMTSANLYEGLLLKENEDNYLQQVIGGTINDERLSTLVNNANILGGSSRFKRNADGTITKGDDYKVINRSSVNDAIDGFEDYNTQLNRQNAVNKANDRYSSKK